MSNRSFIFYPSWLQFIESINGDENKYKMAHAILEYGCSGEHTPVDDMIIENVFQNLVRPLIDNAQDKYQDSVEFGKNRGRKRVAQEDMIMELIAQGYSGKKIADELGITPSAVYKTDAWKNRERRKKNNNDENPAEDFHFQTDGYVF